MGSWIHHSVLVGSAGQHGAHGCRACFQVFALFAVAVWPRCSDVSKIVHSTIQCSSDSRDLVFRYRGTKELKLPSLTAGIGISAGQAGKVYLVGTLQAYSIDPRTQVTETGCGAALVSKVARTFLSRRRMQFSVADAEYDDSDGHRPEVDRWFHPYGGLLRGS